LLATTNARPVRAALRRSRWRSTLVCMTVQLRVDPASSPQTEPRVVLNAVPWEHYEGLLRLLGNEHPSLRMTYRKGMLEIMTTSPEHERQKKMIARLIEAWALECGVGLNGIGSATFRSRAAERGLEPDECYVRGPVGDLPEIAIEVVHSRSALDKLDVYAGLGIREVWIWDDGRLTVHVLAGGAYELRTRSDVVPELDLEQLATFVTLGDQTAAVRAYVQALRGTGA